MSIIILGAKGQLARHLAEHFPDAVAWGRDTVDVADTPALEAALLEAAPRAIINAAAWTAVDQAESDPVAAWQVNAEAPAAAARAARQLDAALLQVSTDYVFDGASSEIYAEDAPTHPLGVYGASKLAGELATRAICPRHWILRTSWVFSAHGSNFVRTILRLARAGGPLRIVADQFGRPTWAGDLARLIAAIEPGADEPRLDYGTYHATGGPAVSWQEFAAEITARACSIGLLSAPVEIQPIATAEYPTPAPRPQRAVLAPSSALADLEATRFDWRDGLDTVLKQIMDDEQASAA